MITHKEFEYFLKRVVNLNKTRFDVARSGIETMEGFIKNNQTFSSLFVEAKPQGSFRQETIIKPVDSDMDFDVDLMVKVKTVPGWEPKDYLISLGAEFKKTDRYKNLVDIRHHKERCVTVDYESDFHIDIVPAIETESGCKIMNKKTNQFESTDGDGYAEWFAARNDITKNKSLVKVTRLLKYIRDFSKKFEVKSILLTTLLGNMVNETDAEAGLYSDIKISFITLISKLDSFLQANSVMPIIKNPILNEEDFNRKWTQEKYSAFRAEIHRISRLSLEASLDMDKAGSLKKWQQIFGDEFAYSADDIEDGDAPMQSTATSVPLVRDEGEQFLSDFGITENLQYNLKLNATVSQNGFRLFELLGTRNPLKKKCKLDFSITGDFPDDCEVKWKVKNYGTEAKGIKQLRGEITDDPGSMHKEESTRYNGSHYVEAYAIRNGVCVAKDRISVPISETY